MYSVHDWAEVHRLHDREQLPKAVIARRLGMSRQTVTRLLELDRPPRNARSSAGSILDPFKDRIAELLDEDARAPATVILERLRREGYGEGVIDDDRLGTPGPGRLRAGGGVGRDDPPAHGLAQGLGHHQVNVSHRPRGQITCPKQIRVQPGLPPFGLTRELARPQAA